MRRCLLAVLIALLAPSLSACASDGRSGAERQSRAAAKELEAGGGPNFTAPKLQAMQQQFEADYARYGTDAAKIEAETGALCTYTGGDAFRVLLGMDYSEWQKAMREAAVPVAGIETTQIYDIDNATARVLSGTCDASGPQGQAVVAGKLRSIMRIKTQTMNDVTVTDQTLHLEGSWRNGARSDDFSQIMITQTATFAAGDDGQLQEKLYDWKYLNERSAAAVGNYGYYTYVDGKPTGYSLNVSRSPGAGFYASTVFEYMDPVHAKMTSYSGSQLTGESTMKNGKLHGWSIIHPHSSGGQQLPGSRNCFQNGELVMTLECPSS